MDDVDIFFSKDNPECKSLLHPLENWHKILHVSWAKNSHKLLLWKINSPNTWSTGNSPSKEFRLGSHFIYYHIKIPIHVFLCNTLSKFQHLLHFFYNQIFSLHLQFLPVKHHYIKQTIREKFYFTVRNRKTMQNSTFPVHPYFFFLCII